MTDYELLMVVLGIITLVIAFAKLIVSLISLLDVRRNRK